MKKTFFYSIAIALTLALGFSSCSDDDDTPQKQEQEQNQNTQNPSGENQNPSGENTTPEVVLVSELKCTVSEFETKYQTLKKDEPVSVTLTDVSNSNISKVSAVLKKMSGTSLQKAAEESKYIVALVLESKDNSLTAIPAEAFKGCAVLKAIEIPESVTEILADAFAGCDILETVKMPETVVVAEGAFEGSKYQSEVEKPTTQEPETVELDSWDLGDYLAKTTADYVSVKFKRFKVTEIVNALKNTDKKIEMIIPDDVTSISGGSSGFEGVSNLVSVVIPNSVKSIGSKAFANCKSLTKVSMPDNDRGFALDMFLGCDNLQGFDKYKNVVEEKFSVSDIIVIAGGSVIDGGSGKITVRFELTTNTSSIKEMSISDGNGFMYDFLNSNFDYKTALNTALNKVGYGHNIDVIIESEEIPVGVYTLKIKSKTTQFSETLGREFSFEIGDSKSSLGSYGSVSQTKSYSLSDAQENPSDVELICAGNVMKKASSAINMTINSNCARTCIIDASGNTVSQFAESEPVVLISQNGTISQIQYSDYNETNYTYTVSGVMFNNTDTYKVSVQGIMMD